MPSIMTILLCRGEVMANINIVSQNTTYLAKTKHSPNCFIHQQIPRSVFTYVIIGQIDKIPWQEEALDSFPLKTGGSLVEQGE